MAPGLPCCSRRTASAWVRAPTRAMPRAIWRSHSGQTPACYPSATARSAPRRRQRARRTRRRRLHRRIRRTRRRRPHVGPAATSKASGSQTTTSRVPPSSGCGSTAGTSPPGWPVVTAAARAISKATATKATSAARSRLPRRRHSSRRRCHRPLRRGVHRHRQRRRRSRRHPARLRRSCNHHCRRRQHGQWVRQRARWRCR